MTSLDRRAQMEARRKRILSNAGSRLEKITGKPIDLDLSEFISNNHDTKHEQSVFPKGHSDHTNGSDGNTNTRKLLTATHKVGSIERGTACDKSMENAYILMDCILFILLGGISRYSISFLEDRVSMPMFLPLLLVGLPRSFTSSLSTTPNGICFNLFTVALKHMNLQFLADTFIGVTIISTLLRYFSIYLLGFLFTHNVIEEYY